MKRPVTTLFAIALCGLSLCLVAAPRAHAQGKALFTARTSGQVYVTVVEDTPEGSAVDWNASIPFELVYAGTVWTIRDDGQITVANTGGRTLLTTQSWYGESQTYFFVHSRNGQQTVDGEIFRYKSDPTKGHANLWLTEPSQDGQIWRTMNIYANLTFDAPQPGTQGSKPSIVVGDTQPGTQGGSKPGIIGGSTLGDSQPEIQRGIPRRRRPR